MQDNQYDEKDEFDAPAEYCRYRSIMMESKVGPWRTNRKFNQEDREFNIQFQEKNRLTKSVTEPKIKRSKPDHDEKKKKHFIKIKPTEKELQFSVLTVKKRLPVINSNFKFHTEALSDYMEDKNYWQPHSLVYINRYIDANETQKTKRDRNILNKIPLIKELNFIRVKKKTNEKKGTKLRSLSKKKQLNKSAKLEPIQIFM